MNLYFCSLRDSSTLTPSAPRNMGKYGGESLCMLDVCVCDSTMNLFSSRSFLLFSRVAFLMAASPSCVWPTLPSSRLSWWRSVTPSSPIAEYALSLQHTLHDMFFNAGNHMLMSPNRVSELPSERAALRCRVHCRGRPVEEDPQCSLSFLHLRTTEGGTDLVSSSWLCLNSVYWLSCSHFHGSYLWLFPYKI